jgi:hypothetical protein
LQLLFFQSCGKLPTATAPRYDDGGGAPLLLYHLNLLQPVPVTDRDVSRVTYDDSAMQILRSSALVRYYCCCMGPSPECAKRALARVEFSVYISAKQHRAKTMMGLKQRNAILT